MDHQDEPFEQNPGQESKIHKKVGQRLKVFLFELFDGRSTDGIFLTPPGLLICCADLYSKSTQSNTFLIEATIKMCA